MDARKAYGVVTALGTKLGERAREERGLDEEIRATQSLDAFRAIVRAKCAGRAPDALVAQFLDEIVTDADWTVWRARLLLQLKLVRDGGKPAPGHEAGRGVGRP